jgi:hypothetical protein
MIGINYKSDLEILGQSQNGFSQDNFLSSLLRITPLNSLTRIDETMLWHEKDWKHGISTRATFVNRKLSPAQGITYNYIDENNRLSVYPYLRTSEFRFLFRFAYDEKFIEGAFNRVSLGTKYPILQMNFVTSIPNLYEGLFSYKKFVLKIEDRLRIHPLLGFSDISIEGGKFWGSAPYPLLELHGGNSTYIYDKMAYNTMNFCEFVSDQYASFWIDHHFEGLFFNKIPLLRRLKWREVVTYKFLIGSISEQNKNEVLFPKTLYDLSSGPYQEVSAGIENIAKIFRVDAFWRLSYQGVHNAADWGIKGGFRLSF